ncbi:T9SS type A sorting domain-containing protein [Soonwooa sp.]|uniref:T9SS-dependent choice-of-anchor J family protein n=1 Tax=Soonwooa sp. TaxID=1938592 RepID=UPI002615F630|nr:T9SS type A sorting domain-containing protein [Soonwooa sp.]
MKKLFYLLTILCIQLTYAQYFFEDFSGGAIPSTWTIKKTNPKHNWEISLEQSDGRYEAVCSAEGDSGTVDEWLITPSFSLQGSTKPYMEMFTNFSTYDAGQNALSFEVLSSIDNGTTWKKLWDTSDFYYWYDFSTMLVNAKLDALKGQANVKLAFRFQGLDPELNSTVWLGKLTVKEDTRIQPQNVEISVEGGASTSVVVGGSIQLNAKVNPSTANQKVVWEIVEGADNVSIWEGQVYTYIPGKATIRAKSVDDPSIYSDIVITVLRDSDPCQQKYDGTASYLAGINGQSNQLVANDISIQANNKFTFKGIKMSVNYDIDHAEDYPPFIINIHEDNNGKPGTIIKTFDNLQVKQPFSGGLYQSIQINFPTTFDFPINASVKKYWLSVTTAYNEYPIRWVAYDIDDNSLPALGSTDNGATWTPKINDNGKGVENIFQILGTCTPVLATAEANNKKMISVYPNPTKGTLYIDSKVKIAEAQLFDMQGKSLKTTYNQTSISLNGLPKAAYLLKIKDVNGNITTQKVIKE